MRTKLGLALIVGTGFVVGCVTVQLSPEASAVRVTANPDAVKGCTFIRDIKGADHFNGGMLGQGAAEENANRQLRNSAADAGANLILLSTTTTGVGGSTQRGEAYACGEAAQKFAALPPAERCARQSQVNRAGEDAEVSFVAVDSTGNCQPPKRCVIRYVGGATDATIIEKCREQKE